MKSTSSFRWIQILGLSLLAISPLSARAYITAPVATLGQLCGSTYITVVRVEKVSKEKGVIVYRKVRDLKGKYPLDVIRHAFDLKNTPQHQGSGDVPVRPDEVDWKYAIQWAEVGKTAVVFSLKYDPYGDFGHTYIDKCWYATMCPKRDWDWWYSIYSDPALYTRWHCGTPGQLALAVEQILAGKTAVVPTLADGGTREDLRAGRARFQGLRVSLEIGDFNPARDRVPWVSKETPALIKDLDHADRSVRLDALRQLAGVGPDAKAALPRLSALFRDKDEETRLAALAALGRIEPENKEIVPAALPFLKHSLPDRRLEAAEILAQARAVPAEVAAVAAVLFGDPALRSRAADVLARLGPAAKPAVPALITGLKDADRGVRIQAADLLGAIGPEAKAAVAALAETVGKDPSGTVRMRSADALTRLGPDARAARPALVAALKDPAMAQRPEVLAKIAEVLEKLK